MTCTQYLTIETFIVCYKNILNSRKEQFNRKLKLSLIKKEKQSVKMNTIKKIMDP